MVEKDSLKKKEKFPTKQKILCEGISEMFWYIKHVHSSLQGEVVLGMLILKQIGKVRVCPNCFKQRGFTESHFLGIIFIPPWDKNLSHMWPHGGEFQGEYLKTTNILELSKVRGFPHEILQAGSDCLNCQWHQERVAWHRGQPGLKS